MSSGLRPLRCERCAAPVPLRDSTTFACPFCGAEVSVPERYRVLFERHALEATLRANLEQSFARAMRPPSRRFDTLALALILVVPSAAVLVAVFAARTPTTSIGMFDLVVVPGLMPATALWAWSAAVHATIVRFQLALAADRAPDGASRCRSCGAPLGPPGDALFVRCHYCGVDSVILETAAAQRRIETAIRTELETADQATHALRVRRRLIAAAVAIVAVVLALASVGLVVVAHAAS